MSRLYLPLVLLAVAALVLVGCGGGGGGGGSTATMDVTGKVIGVNGVLIPDATVTITGGGTQASATTGDDGRFTLAGVPVETSLTVTATSGGTSRTWSGLIVDPSDLGASVIAQMSIPLWGEDIPSSSASVSISPNIAMIPLNEQIQFRAQIMDGGSILEPSHLALWLVVGNVPAQVLTDDTYYGKYLVLSGQTAGTKARATAAARLSDGTTIKGSAELKVADTSDDPVEPPPPPPL